jgi:hypothetical protein
MWLRLAPSAPSGRRLVEVQAASFAPASDPLSTTQVGTPFGEQNSLETVARRAARMPALPPFPTPLPQSDAEIVPLSTRPPSSAAKLLAPATLDPLPL